MIWVDDQISEGGLLEYAREDEKVLTSGRLNDVTLLLRCSFLLFFSITNHNCNSAARES